MFLFVKIFNKIIKDNKIVFLDSFIFYRFKIVFSTIIYEPVLLADNSLYVLLADSHNNLYMQIYFNKQIHKILHVKYSKF